MVNVLMRIPNELAKALENISMVNFVYYTMPAVNITDNTSWDVSELLQKINAENNPTWINISKSGYQLGLDTAMAQIHTFVIIIAVSAMAWFLFDALYSRIQTVPTAEMQYISLQFFVHVGVFVAKILTVSISLLLLLLSFHLIPLK